MQGISVTLLFINFFFKGGSMKKLFSTMLFIVIVGGLVFFASCSTGDDDVYDIVGEWLVSGYFSDVVTTCNPGSIPVPAFENETWTFSGTLTSGIVDSFRWHGTYTVVCDSPCNINVTFDSGLTINAQFLDKDSWSGTFGGSFYGSQVQGQVSATRN
jgi:hypothetical protein